ncbi:MAG: inositol monophosphatase [Candidatus Eremiobacteraeota bacterium]|nr:inositol monophosphatase [Candidatus Eremiobacteraeota bacterium]
MRPGDDLDAKFSLAREAARSAGSFLRSKLGSHLRVQAKDLRTNLVTEADTASEALIKQLVLQHFPHDQFLGEEGGSSGASGGDRWIVDPLDGTTNYFHGYRCFCVSIALERDAVLEFGIVFDPMADEEFSARRGGGAVLNGSALHVSAQADLRDALLITGFPAHNVADQTANLPPFTAFLSAAQAIRRDGSAALDLCYVGAGRVDGFWEPGLHAWDIAAGMLIVAEAGGRTSDYRGGGATLDGARLVASNGHVHAAMLEVLAPYA